VLIGVSNSVHILANLITLYPFPILNHGADSFVEKVILNSTVGSERGTELLDL
jgi:hypothetical protein